MRDLGLLVLRIGLGLSFVLLHGGPKLLAGPAMWESIGKTGMGSIGISLFPTFWGFMAALCEAGGGLMLILGFVFRPACLFMAFTMLAAAIHDLSAGSRLLDASHAIELCVVFLALVLTGAGRYSLGPNWKKGSTKQG